MPLKTLGPIGSRAVRERVKFYKKKESQAVVAFIDYTGIALAYLRKAYWRRVSFLYSADDRKGFVLPLIIILTGMP